MISRDPLSRTSVLEKGEPRTTPLGFWQGQTSQIDRGESGLRQRLARDDRAFFALDLGYGALGFVEAAGEGLSSRAGDGSARAVVAFVPACRPGDLGSHDFRKAHGLRYAYVAGAMANGIGSVEIVEEMARAGMLGFYGAAGQSPEAVAEACGRLERALPGLPWGVNLIHSPFEPGLEDRMVDLLVEHGVGRVEASAYMELTPAVVRYRLSGLGQGDDGRIVQDHRIVAKVSRIEVAEKFLSPPPEKLVAQLLADGHITEQQAALGRRLPVADDLTVEADSAGHTDNRPAIALLPTLLALRDRLQERHGYGESLRIGLGGGISTPASAAAAFALGADYLVTGSVNQACVESGSSDVVRKMLAEAEQADITMAPAADMFEMGVKLQVLKRGTMFPMRAQKLYDLYRAYGSLAEIPDKERALLERTIFRADLGEIWRQTREFFAQRDPAQIERAEGDEKHRMALVFRWYLGQSSRWANAGREDRVLDYQVWCGPAMGAFNEWVRGSFLEDPAERKVALVARNLLLGAARSFRLQCLQTQGVSLPPQLRRFAPLRAEDIEETVP